MGEIEELTREGLSNLGVTYDETTLAMFMEYVDLLWRWNRVFRLTGEPSKREVIKNQLFDSLSIHRIIDPHRPMIDIGSGAGFPGIALKILCPHKQVWLVEANRRKANFLREAQRSLGLKGVVIWEGRGEELKKERSILSYFYESTAKALGDIKKFLTISLPLLVESGSAFAMTGPILEKAFERVAASQGFSNPIVHKLSVPGREEPRTVLQIIKTSFL